MACALQAALPASSLYLAISILGAFLNDRDLGCGQVEQRVDAGVQLGLHAHDCLGALLMLDATSLKPFFPVVAILEQNIALEDLVNLGAEGGKVEVPPGGQFLVECLARRPQIGQDATVRAAVQVVARADLGGGSVAKLRYAARGATSRTCRISRAAIGRISAAVRVSTATVRPAAVTNSTSYPPLAL
jgi:hypothetical protein